MSLPANISEVELSDREYARYSSIFSEVFGRSPSDRFRNDIGSAVTLLISRQFLADIGRVLRERGHRRLRADLDKDLFCLKRAGELVEGTTAIAAIDRAAGETEELIAKIDRLSGSKPRAAERKLAVIAIIHSLRRENPVVRISAGSKEFPNETVCFVHRTLAEMRVNLSVGRVWQLVNEALRAANSTDLEI